MSDDLVAELTLKIRNEMNAEIDAIRNEFGGLDGTLQQLRDVLGGLTDQLAMMTMPSTMADSLQAVTVEADTAAASVQAIGAAAADAATSGQALKDAFAGYGGGGFSGAMTFMPPQPGYEDDGSMRPHFIPPETNILWNGPEQPPVPDDGSGNQHSRPAGDMATNLLFAGLELMTGRDAAEKYADFDWVLTHIGITEKLSGDAAAQEKTYLSGYLDSLASQTGTSSTDLADAYSFLVTTGMNRQLIQQLMPSLAETATAYNVPVMDQAQAVFTLNDVLGISAADMPDALASLAYAAKNGHFTVGDFGSYLPGIGAQMALLKDGGISGEDTAAAALEIVRRVTPDSGTDATDLANLLNYMTSGTAARFFDRTQRSKDLLGAPVLELLDKYHVAALDLPKYFDDEQAKGIDPLDAMVDYMHSIGADKFTKNFSGTGSDEMFIFNSLFHNEEAAKAMAGLVENYDDFKNDEAILKGVGPATVTTDYLTASDSPEVALRKFDEQLTETIRTIGSGLIPTFDVLTGVVRDFGAGLQTIEKAFDIATTPLTTALGTSAAYAAQEFSQHPNGAQRSKFGYNEPLTIHLNVNQSGAVTGATSPTPNVHLRVNQGQVLGTP